jgi:LPXTG-motif cell wall-anchored protein
MRLLSDSPWLIALGIAVLVLVAALVIRGWKRKPAFIRCALSPLPFLAVLWFLWGYPFEIRNLMEALPVLLILMLPPPVVTAVAGDAQESLRPRTRQKDS